MMRTTATHRTMSSTESGSSQVYNAIRDNEDLWNSTLLVILFDEHGGFYDHVSPPSAVPPDARRDPSAYRALCGAGLVPFTPSL